MTLFTKLIVGSSLEDSDRGNADGTQFGVIFGVEFLQLGKDVFAIRVLAERRHVRSDLLKQHLALRRVGNVNHLLDDVVSKLVLHHGVQCTLGSANTANNQSINQSCSW